MTYTRRTFAVASGTAWILSGVMFWLLPWVQWWAHCVGGAAVIALAIVDEWLEWQRSKPEDRHDG